MRGAWVEMAWRMKPQHRSAASLPVRGAWVEIFARCKMYCMLPSLPVRGAWVEIGGVYVAYRVLRSLPVRGAWVEMQTLTLQTPNALVAPRAGSVG